MAVETPISARKPTEFDGRRSISLALIMTLVGYGVHVRYGRSRRHVDLHPDALALSRHQPGAGQHRGNGGTSSALSLYLVANNLVKNRPTR